MVFGIFLTPIGWGLAALVWGYSLVAFIIEDQMKIYFFEILEHGYFRKFIVKEGTD